MSMANQQKPWPLICTLPEDVVKHREPIYYPKMISIGPFYYISSWGYLQYHMDKCLARIRSKQPSDEGAYREALAMMLKDLKDTYRWTGDGAKEDDDVLLEKMMLDAWFLLLIMTATVDDLVLGYDDEDRSLVDRNHAATYRRDALLYQNQIPLQVLAVVAAVQNPQWRNYVQNKAHVRGGTTETSPRSEENRKKLQKIETDIYEFLIKLILKFLSPLGFFSSMSPSRYSQLASRSLHILDVYRNALLLQRRPLFQRKRPTFHCLHISGDASPVPSNQPPESITPLISIPSAVKLQEARIGITQSQTPGLMDISFSKKTLRLPQVFLCNTSMESIFHNLIWFERSDPSVDKHFSSYIYFMSNLLKDGTDSSLLKDRGIIHTTLHDGKVVGLFRDLCKDIEFSPEQSMDTELLKVGQKVRERYNKNSEEWRKDLFQTYLRSPWAIVSLVVAVFIFSMSVIQTIYTTLSYYKE